MIATTVKYNGKSQRLFGARVETVYRYFINAQNCACTINLGREDDRRRELRTLELEKYLTRYTGLAFFTYNIEHMHIYTCTSIKIIKNEVGCRDDTVPKTVDTRRHCEEE